MSEEKKFKIKIRLNTLKDEEDPELGPFPTISLADAVQDWWDNGKGKEHLENYLNNTIVNVKYKSYLHGFSAGDTVDKEAYD